MELARNSSLVSRGSRFVSPRRISSAHHLGDLFLSQQIDIRYALISVLAHRVGQQEAHLPHFVQPQGWIDAISYCHEVLGAEFGAIFVRRATAKWPELLETDAYIEYKTNNQDLFITS